tara:strand:+ start:87 stop:455 length:369 start_codon:yes stop_codon:yes gene_type:complete
VADIPILIGIKGQLLGRTILVDQDQKLSFGRDENNDITIDDDGVSRKHGELSFDNGTLWLQDSGSRNGIYVNGNRIVGHKALKVNDEILIGEHVLRVAWQDSTLDDLEQESPIKKRRWFWPF